MFLGRVTYLAGWHMCWLVYSLMYLVWTQLHKKISHTNTYIKLSVDWLETFQVNCDSHRVDRKHTEWLILFMLCYPWQKDSSYFSGTHTLHLCVCNFIWKIGIFISMNNNWTLQASKSQLGDDVLKKTDYR